MNDPSPLLSSGQDPYVDWDRCRETCPVAQSERMGWELRVVIEELLAAIPDHAPEFAQDPARGYAAVPLRIQREVA